MNNGISHLLADRSNLEKWLLAIVLGATFLVPLGFLIATVATGALFPTTFAALFFGVFVGVLIYVFVDPLTESGITLGGISLGGMAAIVFLFAYVFRDEIDAEMNKTQRDETMAAEITDLTTKLAKANDRAKAAEDALNSRPGVPQAAQIEAAVRAARPDSELGRIILSLLRSNTGPFDPTVRDVTVTVAFNADVPDGAFDFCKSARGELEAPVRFSRVADGDIVGSIQLESGNDVGDANCRQITYEAKLGCDAALKLLTPQEISGCDRNRGILWQPDAERRIQLNATILNPQVMARE